MRKGENAGVKGEYFRIKANLKRTFLNFLSWGLKKGRQKVLPGKWEIVPENLKFFPVRIENFLNRIHDPQDSKRIDAAAGL